MPCSDSVNVIGYSLSRVVPCHARYKRGDEDMAGWGTLVFWDGLAITKDMEYQQSRTIGFTSPFCICMDHCVADALDVLS